MWWELSGVGSWSSTSLAALGVNTAFLYAPLCAVEESKRKKFLAIEDREEEAQQQMRSTQTEGGKDLVADLGTKMMDMLAVNWGRQAGRQGGRGLVKRLWVENLIATAQKVPLRLWMKRVRELRRPTSSGR